MSYNILMSEGLIFHRKIYWKCAPKASPRPLLLMVNIVNFRSLVNISDKLFWKRIIKNSQKILLHFWFWTQFMGIMKNEMGLEPVTIFFSGCQICSEVLFFWRFITWSILMLSSMRFLSYSENYSCLFYKLNIIIRSATSS